MKDEKINNENVNYSFEKYKLNYKIYNPVINAKVSSEFGERVHPISGDTGVHKGIDLALNKGSSPSPKGPSTPRPINKFFGD